MSKEAKREYRIRRKEKQRKEREIADSLLKKNKPSKNFLPLIQEICDAPSINFDKIRYNSPEAMAFVRVVNHRHHNKGLCARDKKNIARLIKVCSKTKMMNKDYAEEYMYAFARICTFASVWVNEPETWIPSSHNVHKQFSSLVRHLFCKYEVPAFLDEAWMSENHPDAQVWFINLGNGENIRKQNRLPIPLTKRMAHEFTNAPSGLSITGAFRWAQVIAMGGDRRTVHGIMTTELARSFENNDFWVPVIRFFINNPMLDTNHYGPIYDYIKHRRFEMRPIMDENNERVLLPPEEPNFTMKGRTVDSLLKRVEKWHEELAKEDRRARRIGYSRYVNTSWKTCGIKGFELEQGKENNKTKFTIFELLSSTELLAEGRLMGHCVGSYSGSCATGSSAIYTLHKETPSDLRKLLTIQVDVHSKTVIQARKRGNARPTVEDANIVQKWANKVGLKVDSYVF